MANQHDSSTLLTLPGKKICFGKSRTHRHRDCTPTNKKGTAMHGCCGALKYCCSCCRRPSECEDPAKMTHSRMAFASRDLCCSVRKVSSNQLCLLASADSEGERGRTGVASVSERERACASQRRCVLFYHRRGVWFKKSRTSRVWTSWVSRAPTMGRRPKATCQFSARSTLGKTPYS